MILVMKRQLELLEVFAKRSPLELDKAFEDELLTSPELATSYSRRINVMLAIRQGQLDCTWVSKAQQALENFAEAEKDQYISPKFRELAGIFRTPCGLPPDKTIPKKDRLVNLDDYSDEDDDEDEEEEGEEYVSGNARSRTIERWEKEKTLPVDEFLDILRDSLEDEVLDIQFDYFALFRSAMSLMLQLQQALIPLMYDELVEITDDRVRKVVTTPEGAVCVIPHVAMLKACNPLEASNIMALKRVLIVDTRPLRAAGKVMRPWIKEHGDDYCVYEKIREVDRVSYVQRPGRQSEICR